MTPAVNDVDADRPVHPDPVAVGRDTVLLVDGIFLQRPELADVWDAAVWVDVPFEVSVPRGNARFGDGHDPDPEAESNRRYVGGQRLYLAAADPRARATWVLDNTDLDRPVLHAAATLSSRRRRCSSIVARDVTLREARRGDTRAAGRHSWVVLRQRLPVRPLSAADHDAAPRGVRA